MEMNNKTFLVTGGTSGLGLSIVRQLIHLGAKVICLGRKDPGIDHPNVQFLYCDFSTVRSVKKMTAQLQKEKNKFDIVINNAGILSPQKYTETEDGLELSFQVNFLTHYILFRFLKKEMMLNNGYVIDVCSPLYLKGMLDYKYVFTDEKYSLVKAYGSTKLYMVLLSELMNSKGWKSYCFDPGTFSSGIYRMQKKWFHIVYKIAAPFMATSDRVAKGLLNSLRSPDELLGKIVDRNGKVSDMKNFDSNDKKLFWEEIDSLATKVLGNAK